MSQLTDVRIPKIPHLDKWIHGVVYGVFSILILIGFKKHRRALTLRHYYRAVLMASSYGFAMEILQLLPKDRSFEWLDMAANLVGAGLGAAVYYGLFKVLNSIDSTMANGSE